MKCELTVIAPCFNEAQNLVELCERLVKTFRVNNINGEVVLVNDGSSDGTVVVMNKLLKKYRNQISVLHHEKNRGIAAAWRTGLNAAESVYVCLIDSDLQSLPEDVGKLYEELRSSGADVVQGWRNHVGVPRENLFRHILSRGLNHILNVLFGMRSKDNKSAFMLCRKEVMREILDYRFKYNYPQTLIGVSAFTKGFLVHEAETLFEPRRAGRSFLSGVPIWVSVLTLADVAKGFFEFRFYRQYDGLLERWVEQVSVEDKGQQLTGWRKSLFKIYGALFYLHHWMISAPALRYYRTLRKSQWMNGSQIKEYQEERLKQLIDQAHKHVPYYREAFDKAGVEVDKVRRIEDLVGLPMIDKGTVRKRLYSGLLADNYVARNLQRVQTSGSTGEPFITFAEKKQLDMRWAATLRSMEWTGYRFGDRQIRLWHKNLGMRFVEVIKERIDAYLSRRVFVPAYEINASNLEDTMKKIMRYKPVLLDGYAESFNLLAKYLKRLQDAGWKHYGYKPRAIISSAQTLYPESRAVIEETFGCKVFDKYGAREFGGGIAYQCEKGEGYHVVAECNIVEIIKDGKLARPGEVGEVVVTDLNNFSVPLIRYRTGDLALQLDGNEICDCGRGLPKIGEIKGRAQSIIVGSNAQFVPGTFFNRVFFKHDGSIGQYQVVQEVEGEIILKIVKEKLFDPSVINEICRDIKDHLGDDMKIVIKYVDNIPMSRAGKRQHCVSRVDPMSIVEQRWFS